MNSDLYANISTAFGSNAIFSSSNDNRACTTAIHISITHFAVDLLY